MKKLSPTQLRGLQRLAEQEMGMIQYSHVFRRTRASLVRLGLIRNDKLNLQAVLEHVREPVTEARIRDIVTPEQETVNEAATAKSAALSRWHTLTWAIEDGQDVDFQDLVEGAKVMQAAANHARACSARLEAAREAVPPPTDEDLRAFLITRGLEGK